MSPTAPRTPTLADVLPALARSLGVPLGEGTGVSSGVGGPGGVDALVVPPARRAVVVLIDGMGHELLLRRRGHAPFLRSLLDRTTSVPAGFPTTTATSMGSFGTGLRSGQHGLLGYEVLDPDRDQVFNELSWEDGPVPELWQPHETVFERVAAAGVTTTRVGPGFFDGSGLTRAALRGGSFVAARTLQDRVDATVSAVRASERALVYLYWGDLDKIGHVHGCESWQWGEELESIDRALAQLLERLPDDCSLTITADHGMVDVQPEHRVDVATTAGLADGLRHVAGEPRALQLHCLPGARDDVLATWRAVLGDRADVVTREALVGQGLFGEVAPHLLPRLGDLLVLSRAGHCVVDSRRHRPELIALIGLHGSTTADEVDVPVMHVPARVVA